MGLPRTEPNDLNVNGGENVAQYLYFGYCGGLLVLDSDADLSEFRRGVGLVAWLAIAVASLALLGLLA